MITYIDKKKKSPAFRLLSVFVVIAFSVGLIIQPIPVAAQTILNLPVPGSMVPVSPGFTPPLVKGITIDPQNPLKFEFIIHKGEGDLKGQALQDEAYKLIKYFLASLTVPEKELWVNLSPYEDDRIIPEGFGVTEMGRDLLAQDYLLKQLTATLMYPEKELGGEFWDKVYAKANAKYGTTSIPINTFNKIWIVPDKAVVFERGTTAFVVDTHLKVMLEQDYVALQSNLENTRFGLQDIEEHKAQALSEETANVVRDILIPEIEREVNEGETFAPLRQIYNSMILATWYKMSLKESLLGQVYVDRNKVRGVDVEDKDIKNKIYQQYLDAFEKGVYNYIKEDYDPATRQVIPRKYFSGGFDGAKIIEAMRVERWREDYVMSPDVLSAVRGEIESTDPDDLYNASVALADIGPDAFQSSIDFLYSDYLANLNRAPGPDRAMTASIRQVETDLRNIERQIQTKRENLDPTRDMEGITSQLGELRDLESQRGRLLSELAELRDKQKGTFQVQSPDVGRVEPEQNLPIDTPALVEIDTAMLSELNRVRTVPARDRQVDISFGTSGWRTDTSEFTHNNVGRAAQALAQVLLEDFPGRVPEAIRIAVGYDARPGADEAARKVVEVLAGNGIHADLIDQVNPTPILAESTRTELSREQRYDAAVHITASHNPVRVSIDPGSEFQLGMKILQNGVPASDQFTSRIADWAASIIDYNYIPFDQIPGELKTDNIDLISQSNERLRTVFDFDNIGLNARSLPGFGVYLDSMHGGTSEAARILNELGVVEEHLRTKPIFQAIRDGDIPRSVTDPKSGASIPWRPEPQDFLLPELNQRLTQGKLGLAFDGDGDRLVIKDLNGEIISPNDLGLIFAHYLYEQGERGVVVRTIPTTHALDRFAQSRNLQLAETPVGSKHFGPFTYGEQDKLLVGIEESGHVFFKYKGEIFADSAIAEALLALEIIANNQMSLTDYLNKIYAEQGQLHYVRTAVDPSVVDEGFANTLRQLRLQEDFPARFVQAVSDEVNKPLRLRNGEITDGVTYDLRDSSGVKVNFDDGTFTMYRISGTDGSIRIYAEDNTPNDLDRMTDAVSSVLQSFVTADRAMLSSVVERHKNNHVPWLKERISARQKDLVALMDQRRQHLEDGQDVSDVDQQISDIVDAINTDTRLDELARNGDLVRADTLTREEFRRLNNGNIFARYAEHARQALMNGSYVPRFLFAGKATRLGLGAMYQVDLWDIAAEELPDVRREESEFTFGMGPRQLLAYRLKIEKTADELGVDREEALSNQVLKIHLNDEVEFEAIQDIVANDFYGFNPAKIYFSNQPEFRGYALDENGDLVEAPSSQSLVYGHGDNAVQILASGELFQVDRSGQKTYLEGDLVSYVGNRILGTHRINDLTKFLTDQVVDIETLAMKLYLFDQGYNLVEELVDNPNKQKGGTAVKDQTTGKSFLFEGIATKGSQALIDLIAQLGEAGAPYNAFRVAGRARDVGRLIQDNELPYYLRYKDGYFYLEAATGDLTQLPDANAAFIETGDVIKDFKERKNAPLALEALRQQDEELRSAGISPQGFSVDRAMTAAEQEELNFLTSQAAELKARRAQLDESIRVGFDDGNQAARQDEFDRVTQQLKTIETRIDELRSRSSAATERPRGPDPRVVDRAMRVNPADKVVLIVEDETLIRWNLERYFEGEGYQVRSVSSSQDALQILESGGQVDVVVTDFNLPEINGGELARRFSDKPFIIFSGGGYSAQDVNVPNIKSVIDKLASSEEILAAVNGALLSPEQVEDRAQRPEARRDDQSGEDEAMTGDVEEPKQNVGGIDLNPEMLDLQIRRDGNGVPLPINEQPLRDMHIEGFLPIIINITPVTNLPLLLGIADTEEEPVDLGYNSDPFDRKARFEMQEAEEIVRLN